MSKVLKPQSATQSFSTRRTPRPRRKAKDVVVVGLNTVGRCRTYVGRCPMPRPLEPWLSDGSVAAHGVDVRRMRDPVVGTKPNGLDVEGVDDYRWTLCGGVAEVSQSVVEMSQGVAKLSQECRMCVAKCRTVSQRCRGGVAKCRQKCHQNVAIMLEGVVVSRSSME